jgi:anti-repressor protein
MNKLTVFSFEGQEVRTVLKDNEPWFVAKDVCDILSISNANMATARLDEDEVSQAEVIDNLGRKQMTNIVNEMGLYNLVLRSDKSEAKAFKRWVTHEVLPAIRKTGVYVTPQVDSKMLYQIAQALEEKEKQIALLTPAAEFGNAVGNCQDSILIRDFAKVLANASIRIGQAQLFSWLHANGYIYRDKGTNDWIAKQKYVDQGLFRIKETPYSTNTGGDRITITTKVTGKGQRYFYEKLKVERKAV